MARAAPFQNGKLLGCTESGEIALAKQRTVVERELAIERDDTPVAQERQRIDLNKLGVALPVDRVQRL